MALSLNLVASNLYEKVNLRIFSLYVRKIERFNLSQADLTWLALKDEMPEKMTRTVILTNRQGGAFYKSRHFIGCSDVISN